MIKLNDVDICDPGMLVRIYITGNSSMHPLIVYVPTPPSAGKDYCLLFA